MDEKTANKVIAVIEEQWQERRNAYAMDTATHNREQANVEDLKKRITDMIESPAPASKSK